MPSMDEEVKSLVETMPSIGGNTEEDRHKNFQSG